MCARYVYNYVSCVRWTLPPPNPPPVSHFLYLLRMFSVILVSMYNFLLKSAPLILDATFKCWAINFCDWTWLIEETCCMLSNQFLWIDIVKFKKIAAIQWHTCTSLCLYTIYMTLYISTTAVQPSCHAGKIDRRWRMCNLYHMKIPSSHQK